jgi:hypothetical protein
VKGRSPPSGIATEEDSKNWVPSLREGTLKLMEMTCGSVVSELNSWNAISTSPLLRTKKRAEIDPPVGAAGVQVVDPARDIDNSDGVPSFGSNPGIEPKKNSWPPIGIVKFSTIVAAEAVTGAAARPNAAKTANVNARIFPSIVGDESAMSSTATRRPMATGEAPLPSADVA